MKNYFDIEDLEVYRKLCQLHLPQKDRRWQIAEAPSLYGDETDIATGYPTSSPDH